MAKKIQFSGFINGKHFDNVTAYNEELCKLIKEGADFSADSSTTTVDEPEHNYPGIQNETDLTSGAYIDRILDSMSLEDFAKWCDEQREDVKRYVGDDKYVEEIKFILKNLEEDFEQNGEAAKELDKRLQSLQNKYKYLCKSQDVINGLLAVYNDIYSNIAQKEESEPEPETVEDSMSNIYKLFKEIFG